MGVFKVTNLVELRDVSIQIGSSRVLESLSLEVKAGEHVLISGPSGSGKTTLLHTLARLLLPHSGTLRFAGVDAPSLPNPARFRLQEIGFVFQEFNLIEALSVRENLHMVALASGKAEEVDTDALLTPLGLLDKRERRVRQLSRGERQRVALARAFANRPRLLLADEPTSSLDPQHRDRTMAHLFELAERQGVTAVVVSHDVALQGDPRFGARYVLDAGKLRPVAS